MTVGELDFEAMDVDQALAAWVLGTAVFVDLDRVRTSDLSRFNPKPAILLSIDSSRRVARVQVDDEAVDVPTDALMRFRSKSLPGVRIRVRHIPRAEAEATA